MAKKEGKVFEKTGTGVWPDKMSVPMDHSLWEEPVQLITNDVDGGDGRVRREVALVMREAFQIFKKKNADYGPGNLGRFGLLGVVVRLSDKMARLEQLVINGNEANVADESIRDTLLDMLNYVATAIVIMEEKWDMSTDPVTPMTDQNPPPGGPWLSTPYRKGTEE